MYIYNYAYLNFTRKYFLYKHEFFTNTYCYSEPNETSRKSSDIPLMPKEFPFIKIIIQPPSANATVQSSLASIRAEEQIELLPEDKVKSQSAAALNQVIRDSSSRGTSRPVSMIEGTRRSSNQKPRRPCLSKQDVSQVRDSIQSLHSLPHGNLFVSDSERNLYSSSALGPESLPADHCHGTLDNAIQGPDSCSVDNELGTLDDSIGTCSLSSEANSELELKTPTVADIY